MVSLLVAAIIQHGVVFPHRKQPIPPLPKPKLSARSPKWSRREFRIPKEHIAFSAIVPKAAKPLVAKGKVISPDYLSDGHDGTIWFEYSTNVDRLHWESLLKPPPPGYDDNVTKDGKTYRNVVTHREVHRNGWIGHLTTTRLIYSGVKNDFSIEIQLTNQKDMKICDYQSRKGFQLLDEDGLWKIIDSMKLL